MEKATHTVGQRRLERERARRSKEVVRGTEGEEDSKSGVPISNNLNIETAGTDEEVA